MLKTMAEPLMMKEMSAADCAYTDPFLVQASDGTTDKVYLILTGDDRVSNDFPPSIIGKYDFALPHGFHCQDMNGR